MIQTVHHLDKEGDDFTKWLKLRSRIVQDDKKILFFSAKESWFFFASPV